MALSGSPCPPTASPYYPSLSSLLSSSPSASPLPYSLSLRPSFAAQQHLTYFHESSALCSVSPVDRKIFSHRWHSFCNLPSSPRKTSSLARRSLCSQSSSSTAGDDGRNREGWDGGSGSGGGSGGGDGRGDEADDGPCMSGKRCQFGLFSSFSEGWRERVEADPQFLFKILTEEIIGVAASVLGDMSCRPGFGLGELDFIFCNLIVCAIVNFMLMYILAPTPSMAVAGGPSLPGLFSACPPGHMWEVGAYSVVQRAGTFIYKGALFAMVGFGAGLVGTALSTALLNIRRKLDRGFTLQNVPPSTLLNACTWALQLGVSSNTRYQLLNGVEFGLEGMMKPDTFKGLVFVMRLVNNVVGGMSFMMMARLTGSQDQQSKHALEMKS